MKVIRITKTIPDAQVASLQGWQVYDHDYDRLISNAPGDDVKLLKPDGSPLLVFKCQALPAWACDLAYPALLQAAVPSDNRGTASGMLTPEDFAKSNGGEIISPTRYVARKHDDRLSSRTRGRKVLSGIAGYMDGVGSLSCRTTSFTARKPEQWALMQPMIGLVDGVFRDTLQERYAAQVAAVQRTLPKFTIPGTAFSTVTVNRNYQTTVHKDDGDLQEGFGVITVIDKGSYSGGLLVFPAYRVAVDIRQGDVLLCDVHEYHGNTPIIGELGQYERISTVYYYRTRLQECD